MRAGEASPSETEIARAGKAVIGVHQTALQQRVQYQRLQRRSWGRGRPARQFRSMRGHQAPRLTVHQHTGAMRSRKEAIDAFRPRDPFGPSSGGKQTRDGVAAQHGLVIPEWHKAPPCASGRGSDVRASLGWVAVGMPVTRHPPHRPVLALLTHTVLTSDIWRQTAHSATGVEPRPGGVWHQVAPENEPTSIGSSGSAGVSGGTTNEAPHYGTPSFAPG